MEWGFDNKLPCMIENVCLFQNNGIIKPNHRSQKKKGRKHKSHLQVLSQFDAGQGNLRKPRVSHVSNFLYFVKRLNKEDKDTTAFSQCN